MRELYQKSEHDMVENDVIFRRIIRHVVVFILLLPFLGTAAVFRIQPYAQWTFDTPIERVVYRASGNGFPIQLILMKKTVTLYDDTGNRIREINRTPGDQFTLNHNQSGFMLTQIHASNTIERGGKIFSFQVFDMEGNPEFTVVKEVAIDGELDYVFTGERRVLLSERGYSYVLEIAGEDTTIQISSCQSGTSIPRSAFALARKLKHKDELITAVSCQARGDSVATELRLWNGDQVLGSPVLLSESLVDITVLPESYYYFMETEKGGESSLALYNRTQQIASYPWHKWKIQQVDPKTAFVISEKDFNVVSLGDGSIAASYHPIDLSSISDAIYLPGWDIYLYLRYEAFYRENGRQAYRNFTLEGVNKTGQIVHRSSFGTWTYSLPKIATVSQDLFGIHIHNAVLMYGIRIDNN